MQGICATLRSTGEVLACYFALPCPDNRLEGDCPRPAKALHPVDLSSKLSIIGWGVIVQWLASLTVWGCSINSSYVVTVDAVHTGANSSKVFVVSLGLNQFRKDRFPCSIT